MGTAETREARQFSRRTLLKGAGAAGIGLVALPALNLATAGTLEAAAKSTESVQSIINIAATAEALAVTLLGVVINQIDTNKYSPAIPSLVADIVVAAQAEEQFHYDYLVSAGAKPLYTTFYLPAKDQAILTDPTKLFPFVVTLEEAFIAAYIAAAGEFTDMMRPDLVKVASEIAGVEAEHRVLANYAAGNHPANDLAFEQQEFATVGDAATALAGLGFFTNSDGAASASYPGPVAIDSSGVSYQAPNGPNAFCYAFPESFEGGPRGFAELIRFLRAFHRGQIHLPGF